MWIPCGFCKVKFVKRSGAIDFTHAGDARSFLNVGIPDSTVEKSGESYEELEFMFLKVETYRLPRRRESWIRRSLQTLGQDLGLWIQSWLSPEEVQIWTRKNADGSTVWYVQEAGYSGSFASEDELRVWLDTRYYTSPEAKQHTDAYRFSTFR